MSIREAARRAVLIAPPIRRLHRFARQLSSDNAEYQQSLNRLSTELDAVTRQLEAERMQLSDLSSAKEALEEQLNKLILERESAELQLYVMRSDQQRAATRNESLAKLLQESSLREKDVRSRVASLIKQLRNSNSRFRQLASETAVSDGKSIADALLSRKNRLMPSWKHFMPSSLDALLSYLPKLRACAKSKRTANLVPRAMQLRGAFILTCWNVP